MILRLSALPARARKIAEEIALLEACIFVALTFGQFEIVAVLVNNGRTEAAEMIDKRSKTIQGVQTVDVREPVS